MRLQRRPHRSPAAAALATAAMLALAALSLAGPVAAQPAEGKGLVRLAHFAPELVVGDIYVVSVNGRQVLDDVPYKAVSDYLQLDPGTYEFEVRGSRAPSTSPPEAKLSLDVEAGQANTIAVYGTPDGASAIVLDDDMRQPADGKVRVRVVNAFGQTWPVDVADPEGGMLADDMRAGSATEYVELPAGPRALEVRRPGDDEVLSGIERLRFEPGTVATVAVVGATAEDCTLLAVRDAAGLSELPAGGIATGAGGGAGSAPASPNPGPGQTAPWVLYVGLASGAVAGVALLGRARRRRDPSLPG